MTTVEALKTIKVSSSVFREQGKIPAEYTRDGKNINPEITLDGIPQEAKCLAIVVDDPDAPQPTSFVHWLVWNIPVSAKISSGIAAGTEGRNDFGNVGYDGPAPPSGTHRYHFKVYALDDLLKLPAGSSVKKLYKAMNHHVIAHGELIGIYGRTQ